MNLYQLTDLESAIEGIAAQNDGEIAEDQLAALVVAQTTAIGKITNICQYIRNLELFQDAAKAEEARIATQRKRATNLAASLEKYLTPYIASKGKLQAGTFTLSIRKSKSIVINDPDSIPKEFINTVVTESIDKKAIKMAIDAGTDVPGAMLAENDNLQIK